MQRWPAGCRGTSDDAETTVKIHVQHILRKLQVSSRVQAAVYEALLPVQPGPAAGRILPI